MKDSFIMLFGLCDIASFPILLRFISRATDDWSDGNEHVIYHAPVGGCIFVRLEIRIYNKDMSKRNSSGDSAFIIPNWQSLKTFLCFKLLNTYATLFKNYSTVWPCGMFFKSNFLLSKSNMNEKHLLTLKKLNMQKHLDVYAADAFLNHCMKRRKCSWWTSSTFETMLSHWFNDFTSFLYKIFPPVLSKIFAKLLAAQPLYGGKPSSAY